VHNGPLSSFADHTIVGTYVAFVLKGSFHLCNPTNMYACYGQDGQKITDLLCLLCPARECTASAHPPASPCYRNRFPYGRVPFGDAQINQFFRL